MIAILLVRFLGLWIFSLIVYAFNRYKSPSVADDTQRRVEMLIQSGEVECSEVTTDFIDGVLLFDMILRTLLVTIFCIMLWSFIE
jgi:hypothetical protein